MSVTCTDEELILQHTCTLTLRELTSELASVAGREYSTEGILARRLKGVVTLSSPSRELAKEVNIFFYTFYFLILNLFHCAKFTD